MIMSSEFAGTVLHPSEAGYDEARAVFNGMIDRKPERIRQCSTASDVAAAIASARADGMPVSVYGGGHGGTGSAVVDGGVCVDLRGIAHVEVDPGSRTVRVGGGATWGAVDAATQEHGLAVTGGRVSTTGVGGLSLGSGSGWLERAFGFTCDNLISAGYMSMPPSTIGPTSWRRKWNAVTIPKFPPPPRSPQNRSACSSTLA
jgi:FAD/FMN-containing dehydrogenase